MGRARDKRTCVASDSSAVSGVKSFLCSSLRLFTGTEERKRTNNRNKKKLPEPDDFLDLLSLEALMNPTTYQRVHWKGLPFELNE